MKSIYDNQCPAGCEPYQSRGDAIVSSVPVGVQPGVSLAPFSGVDYNPPVPRCAWYDHSCRAPRVRGTEFCVGHLKRFIKQQADQGLVLPEETPVELEPEQAQDGADNN